MRTDRTHLCGYCSLRFPAAATCPECGRDRVYDLTVARKRRNGLRMVRRHRGSRGDQRARRLGDLYYGYVSLTISVGAGLLTWSFGKAIFAYGALVCVGLAMGAVVKRLRGPREGPVVPFIRLLPPPEPDPRVARHSARGTVRIIEPVRAPISGTPCAAYRLLGQGPAGVVDEAGVGRFAVEGDPGGPARVDTRGATVELAVGEPTRVTPPGQPFRSGDRLYRLLRERGVCPHLGESQVAEALLVDGDPVEVVGSADDVATPGGYRDVSYERVFREREGSPLVVRAPSAERALLPAELAD